jgi:hypothetical protein
MLSLLYVNPSECWNQNKKVKVKVILQPTVSRPVSLVLGNHLGTATSFSPKLTN